MKKVVKLLLVMVLALWLSACESKLERNEVPEPPPPPTTDPGRFDPTDPNLPDDRLPVLLEKAVPVNLINKTTYEALFDIALDLQLPLVGDPLIAMQLTQNVGDDEGSVLFAFEDQFGFWGALLNSFPGTGTLTSTTLDMIFADDELVLRTIGAISSGQISGTIFYRIRRAGEDACKQVVVTCDVVQENNGEWPWWWGQPPNNEPEECEPEPVDTATPCRAYMNTGHARVKALGTFGASVADWLED